MGAKESGQIKRIHKLERRMKSYLSPPIDKVNNRIFHPTRRRRKEINSIRKGWGGGGVGDVCGNEVSALRMVEWMSNEGQTELETNPGHRK